MAAWRHCMQTRGMLRPSVTNHRGHSPPSSTPDAPYSFFLTGVGVDIGHGAMQVRPQVRQLGPHPLCPGVEHIPVPALGQASWA